MPGRAPKALLGLTLFMALCVSAFADAQERLMKEAAAELISLNDEMLKGLNLTPKDLEGKKVYVRAHIQEKPDGTRELKVEEVTLGEPSKETSDGGKTLYFKGTVKPQSDRTWKLSIDDVLPEEPKKPEQGPNKNSSKEDMGK